MTARPLLPLTLIAPLLFAACAKDQKSDPTPSPAPSPSSPIASASASASAAPQPVTLSPTLFCARVFGSVASSFANACTDDDKKSPSYQMAAVVAGAPLSECNAAISSAVAAGRLGFDSGVAVACADAADKQKKTLAGIHLSAPDLDELPACKGLVVAKQLADQPCKSSLECVAPLTCIGAGGGKDGACKPLPTKAGDACDAVVWRLHDLGHRPRCAPGLACDLPDEKNKTATCRAAVAKGGACVDSDECGDGLACHNAKCDDGPAAGAGGACIDDEDDCLPGLYCARPKGSPSGTCATKKSAGAPCTDVFECRGECRKSDAGTSSCAAICGSG